MDSPSQAQEKRVAKLMGGKVQPQSGAGWVNKGDVKADTFLVECKTTSALSYRLKLSDLEKIDRQAMLENKEAALFVEIYGCRYVVLREDCFIAIKEATNGAF